MFADIPPPSEISIREREDAMGAYLMMFASLGAGLPFPFLNLIAAIIYYYINKGKSRFVRFHALQSLLSQTPLTLLNSSLVAWFLVYFFQGDHELLLGDRSIFLSCLAVMILLNILYISYSIVAAVKARKGRMYYFVFFGKLAYMHAFDEDLFQEEVDADINFPPNI